MALLTLASAALTVSPVGDHVLGSWEGWVIFLIPILLSVTVLLAVATALVGLVYKARPNSEIQLGSLLVRFGFSAITVGLALLTLLWIVGTAYVLVFGSDGGVLFGLILALFTGSLLAAFVLGRFAILRSPIRRAVS